MKNYWSIFCLEKAIDELVLLAEADKGNDDGSEIKL